MKTNIFLLILCSGFWIQLNAQLVSIKQSEKQSMVLEFQLESYHIDKMSVSGNTFDMVKANNCGFFHIKGEPTLPYYAKSIIIPDSTDPKIEILEISFKEIVVNKVLPSRGPLPVGLNADDIPWECGEVYDQDKFYPEKCAEIGEPYILRDLNGAVLYFNPFQYNPVQHVLKIATSIEIKVIYTGEMPDPPKIAIREFHNIYTNHFINYPNDEAKYPAITDVGDMIIITTAEFIGAVEPLATWKNRKGIPTTTYLYPDETGSSATEIKNFIQQIYDQTGTLTFILLVGDAEDIPPASGYAGWPGYPADPVYTLLAGDDEYPDAFIGRFSVETPEEAEIVVNKNLWYETDPDPEGEWYHKATGIASDEVFPPAPPDSVIIENVRQALLEYGYTHVDQFYDPGATHTELIDAIEEGRGMVNYAGHGYPGSWGTTGMFNYLVSLLTNSFKTPLIISTSCSVGSFVGQSCFSEFWQRQGTTEEPQGAIAFMGCPITQYAVAGFAHQEMVNLLVSEAYFSVGGFFTNGVMTAIEYYPGLEVGGGPQCFQSWLLFGDPSLSMYTKTPTEMTVDFSNLMSGETSMVVSVSENSIPLPDALAALYMDDSLYGACYTNENGLAEIVFEEAIQTTGIMELNVTSRNKIPVFETVLVTGLGEPGYSNNFSISPNPGIASSTLRFSISEKQKVQINLYNISGAKITQLINEEKMAGVHEVKLDLGDLLPGIYFCTLKTSEGVKTMKMIKL